MTTTMKYNVVSNDGDASSATVFFGSDSYVATKEHPKFSDIVAALGNADIPDDHIRGLFDVSVPIGKLFTHLSERVTVNNGRIFFDGVLMENALTQTIVRFYNDGYDDFMPLVNFLEKVQVNPIDHSRQQLFSWLTKHRFAICPDGDFIAYKGVTQNDLSGHSGTAMVNGQVITGQIPNRRDTIVEMARDKVAHSPSQACSSGLHVANWGFAKSWVSGGKCVRIKINPRDVVSVPTDAGGAKMRVCRYRVLDVVTAEDTTALFVDVRERIAVDRAKARPSPKPKAEPRFSKPRRVVIDRKGFIRGSEPAKKKAPPTKKAAAPKYPKYYEQFTKAQFETLPWDELRWVAKEFEVRVPRGGKAALLPLLVRKARSRLRTWT